MARSTSSDGPMARLAEFRRAVIGWFESEGRDYPWRRTRDPYAVLVSEIMLQQTQIATVLDRGYYTDWMAKFPDVRALAKASEEEVLKSWEGLGYYRRARNLQKAARHVVAELGGEFPVTVEGIRELPGVGRYTAGAVASFAYGLPAPIVDANIARVLARLFDFRERIDTTSGERQLWQWAEGLVPDDRARTFNSGLMEIGQTACAPRNPDCNGCPVRSFCGAVDGDPESLPAKKPRTKTVFLDEHVVWVRRADGSLLLQEESEHRRDGFWKLPALEDTSATARLPVVLKSRYSITHHRVTLFVHEDARTTGAQNLPESHRWFPPEDWDRLPMRSPYRKALVALRESAPIFAWKESRSPNTD